MSFFSNLFKKPKPKITCPRCLGKGQVDWEDIKRLKKELKWTPDTCAYCGGSGKVDFDMESKVLVDKTYLTTDLSKEERQKIIDNDSEAIKRGQLYEIQINHFIERITFQHFTEKLEAETIAEFYMLSENEATDKDQYIKEKEELIEYIKKVIEHKS